MKKHNQKGFTVIEIAIVLIVIGALAFGGYYVWHRNKNTKSDSAQTAANAVSWFAYESQNKQYRLNIPDGWILSEINATESPTPSDTFVYDSELFAEKNADLTETSGVRAKIILNQTRPAEAALNIFFAPKGTFASGLSNLPTSTTKKTKQDLPIDISFYHTTGSPAGPARGDQYWYFVTKGDKEFSVLYYTGRNGVDQHDLVESMVQTIEIL